ncbi:MAG TPA: DUF222 domain-containing protein [Actinomycetes bacterium]|nr:DUF222 domain-containing protein [Actinomycetes bacterium]
MELPLRPVRQLGDAALRDRLVELERVVNSAQAAQAEVMVEMAHRAHRADDADRAASSDQLAPLGPGGTREEFVIDEIALHLHCTKVAASHRFGTALAATDHPPLQAAWAEGRIDARKVQLIHDGLRDVSEPAVGVLADQAAEYASTRTGPEVRRWLCRRVIAADPGMAEIRRARAVEARRVMVTPLPDGVSELSALLPSIKARQVYDTVNALARAVGSDDIRTMDQRRADALFDLLCGRAEPPQVSIAVTVPVDVLLGKSAEPGDVCGVGAVTSSEVLRLTGGAPEGLPDGDAPLGGVTYRQLLIDPETGVLRDIAERRYRPSAGLDRAVRARDGVCRFPGCNRSAHTARSGTDLDHTIPWPRGQTSAANLAVLCRHHHRLKHSPGWHAELDPDGVMRWSTPSGETVVTYPWAYAEPAITDSG